MRERREEEPRFTVETKRQCPSLTESDEAAARRQKSISSNERLRFLEELEALNMSERQYGHADWSPENIEREIERLKTLPAYRQTGLWRLRDCRHCKDLLIADRPAQRSHVRCKLKRRIAGKQAWQNRPRNKCRINEAKRRGYRNRKSGTVRGYRRSDASTDTARTRPSSAGG
jgi:hypothetical protein